MPLLPTDPKIVIKPLFSILCLRSVNSAEARKNGDFCFLNTFHHENILVYHNSVVFSNEYRREVLYLGLESIELGPIRTKYLNWMMRHTYYVCVSYPIVRSAYLSIFDVILSIFMPRVVTNYWISVNHIKNQFFM